MVREVEHARKRHPLSDLNEILQVVDVPDIITCANFGDDRLRGVGVAGVKVCHSPLTLMCRPYNTLALPCECVMTMCDNDYGLIGPLPPLCFYHAFDTLLSRYRIMLWSARVCLSICLSVPSLEAGVLSKGLIHITQCTL